MTVIRQQDFIDSVADSLQYISYYHPADYIKALGDAYEREQSAAAKDAILVRNSDEFGLLLRGLFAFVLTGIVCAFVVIRRGRITERCKRADGVQEEHCCHAGVFRKMVIRQHAGVLLGLVVDFRAKDIALCAQAVHPLRVKIFNRDVRILDDELRGFFERFTLRTREHFRGSPLAGKREQIRTLYALGDFHYVRKIHFYQSLQVC